MTRHKKIILVIDNDGGFIGSFKRVLARKEFDDDFTCEGVVPSSADLFDDCIRQAAPFLSRPEQITAVLIDIVLDETVKPTEKAIDSIDRSGLDVAAELRKTLPTTPILGMTQWGKVQSLLTDLTLDENLDGVLLKNILISLGFSKSKFNEYIFKASKKSAKRRSGGTLAVEDTDEVSIIKSGKQLSTLNISNDRITAYQATLVGSHIFDSILYTAFGDAIGNIKYFIPGFSGAMLFEVNLRPGHTDESQAAMTSWILKVSKEKEKLEAELRKHAELKLLGIEKEFYPSLLKEELISVGSWHAMITQKEIDSQTLYSYLQTNPNPKTIVELIDKGLKNFLSQLFGKSVENPQIIWQTYYKLTAKEIAAILAILDDKRTTFRHHAGSEMGVAIDRLEKFVDSNGSSERSLYIYNKDVDTRRIHGDFHSRNVLVSPDKMKITTIDFPNIGQDHAAKDFSKLETDLIFSAMDSYSGADTDWNSLTAWQSILSCLEWDADFFDEHSPAVATELSYIHIISVLRACAKSILPTLTSEEYLISLLYYSLKLLPYPDISLPKKAFALQYTNKILEQLSARIE